MPRANAACGFSPALTAMTALTADRVARVDLMSLVRLRWTARGATRHLNYLERRSKVRAAIDEAACDSCPTCAQCTFSAHSVHIKCTSSAHSGHIQCTSSAHSVRIQCTSSAHPEHIQSTFSASAWNTCEEGETGEEMRLKPDGMKRILT